MIFYQKSMVVPSRCRAYVEGFLVCVTTLVMEMFLSKMRKLKGIRKVLTIDEAWKAIANSGMAGFIQYAFKTMRKFNGEMKPESRTGQA